MKYIKFPFKRLIKEIRDYFDMIPDINVDYIRRELNKPRNKILHKYNLSKEDLKNVLCLPEILLLADQIKENNFNYFENYWYTIDYNHYDHGYILKDLIRELTPYSKKIKDFREHQFEKALKNEIFYESSNNKKSGRNYEYINEDFSDYLLPEFENFKELINQAYNDHILYKIVPILLRCLLFF
ncbi:MAG: hypothetical protein EU548_01290 [Promethearchaeota archaeon]|nr:MAG: hypothetical protein EU548_01290 [Candidatus Lokiarchaeota archaeon]